RFPQHGPALKKELTRIDAELTVERAPAAAGAAPPRKEIAPRPAVPVPVREPAPAIVSVGALLRELRHHPLLAPAQFDEAWRALRPRHTEPRGLARALLERGWLTAYQVNQLLQGRGAELVFGPYVLLERLGEGGAGQVFKARHQKMERVVALKVIRKELLTD